MHYACLSPPSSRDGGAEPTSAKTDEFKPLLEDPQIKDALVYMSDAAIAEQGPAGFSASYGWTSSGERVPFTEGGISYMASCMLAVIGPRGSLISQSVNSLKRASEADRTFPKGEFRFALTSDVRTRTRLPGVANALVYLAEDGQKADIIRETIPSQPGDVAGLMFGTADYKLLGRRWNFVPGAIADNLTSVSGAFEHDSQTKFTELLNAGVAMTSGSVAEPFAVQAKFPVPMMYAYYADGVTAIEAFYLSIHSPYQTLIVGDPLCQPYAKAPNEWVDIELSSSTPRVVQFQRKPTNLSVPSGITRMIDIYVEGKLIKQSPPVGTIRMNLPENTAGVAEVRAVLNSDRRSGNSALVFRGTRHERHLTDPGSHRDEDARQEKQGCRRKNNELFTQVPRCRFDRIAALGRGRRLHRRRIR